MKEYSKYPVRIALLLAMVVFVACNDWLTVPPANNLIKEKFWKKTDDVNGALAATYNAMRDAHMNSLILGECRADLVSFRVVCFTITRKLPKAISAPPTEPFPGRLITKPLTWPIP